ncbi:hypothetical protein MKS88_004074 [Plasmodium brasilianum]|uniref:Uncharacterized protein n=2 Tax=Plasmodium (Plasmodium) TaxID=418103 RepID=A0A1D3SNT7_PLAMA|nr:conserved Plasmodium protein, unknown function [Plasmodium malariae]KAI4836284.1 hypothetical protein MKS88_004074 [Plasmodium brasilianum]SCO93548.1 conserved Plasmodium protein, unknown function [Plasmodium malariae]
MNEQCYILPGEFGVVVQVIIGFVSLSILLTKFILEKPRRTFVKFIKDVIVILCGSTTLHFVNIFLCIFIFQYHILSYISKIDMDECSIYFIQIIIDASVGLYLEYKIFSLFKFLKFRKEYLYNNSSLSVYKPVDALSHYSSFVKFANNNNVQKYDDNKSNSNDDNRNNRVLFIGTYSSNLKEYVREENSSTFSSNNSKNEKGKDNNNNNKEVYENKIFKENYIFNTDNIVHNCTTYDEAGHAEQADDKVSRQHVEYDEKYGGHDKYEKYGGGNYEDYKNELKLLTDELQDEDVHIELNENMQFNEDEIIIYENKNSDMPKHFEEKYIDLNLFQSVLLWISVILTAKSISLLLFFLFSPIFNILVLHSVAHISDMRYKLLVVMIIVPFFFNFIIYFFTDCIIKRQYPHGNVSNDKI